MSTEQHPDDTRPRTRRNPQYLVAMESNPGTMTRTNNQHVRPHPTHSNSDGSKKETNTPLYLRQPLKMRVGSESASRNGSSSEKNTAGSGLNSQVEIETDIAQPSLSVDRHILIPMETSMHSTTNVRDPTEKQEEVD